MTAVQNGEADWMLDEPPADRLGEIGTKNKDQVHVTPLTAWWYVPMNTQARALRQRESAPGRELRHRPQGAGQPLRRPGARPAGVPGPAAGLPRA